MPDTIETPEIVIKGPLGTTMLCSVRLDGAPTRYVVTGDALDIDGLIMLAQGILEDFVNPEQDDWGEDWG